MDAEVNDPRVVAVTVEPAVAEIAVTMPFGAPEPEPEMNAAASSRSNCSEMSPGSWPCRLESSKISYEPTTYALNRAAVTDGLENVGEPSVNAEPSAFQYPVTPAELTPCHTFWVPVSTRAMRRIGFFVAVPVLMIDGSSNVGRV